MDAQTREFVHTVTQYGEEHYRDFAWRRTTDPYEILVSETMLQQTQVSRVERYYPTWLCRFPVIDVLAEAELADVLDAWQGLGYNRRALLLKRAAEEVSTQMGGKLPRDEKALRALPGIGPTTAAGICAFAYNEPVVYLETNSRTVVLHECFPDHTQVPDSEVYAVLEAAVVETQSQGIEPRMWNYALLDYGAHLKRTFPNPARRSKHHTRQSAFEGSRRQKRAVLLRIVMENPDSNAADYADICDLEIDVVESVLADLTTEGFLSKDAEGRYSVRSG